MNLVKSPYLIFLALSTTFNSRRWCQDLMEWIEIKGGIKKVQKKKPHEEAKNLLEYYAVDLGRGTGY